MAPTQIPVASSELESLDLGDTRLVERCRQIVDTVAENPSTSFPDAFHSEAGLEAFYRFVNNDRVTPKALLGPHYVETCARAEAARQVLVLHDTTEVQYSGETRRKGLGRLSGNHQGYFAHVALAVDADAGRRPLGVLGLETHGRSWAAPKKRTYASRKVPQSQKESGRWRKLVDVVEDARKERFEVVHVMDREADSYELLAHLCRRNAAFVIRVQHNRLLEAVEAAPVERLETRISRSVPVVGRSAKLSPRAKRERGPESIAIHPVREQRMAQLVISALAVTVQGTTCPDPEVPGSLKLHCVHVDEPDPPAGQEPVCWRLWTLLPIDTPEQLLAIVDIYRTRWLIEEFFKALKTGCALEKRQQESKESLLNVFALLVPIAWRLLLIRHLARQAPDAPATLALTEVQLEVLRAFAPRQLSPAPTVREALGAIAALGGHLRNNGAPGWLVLGRGLEKLLTMEAAWSAARGKM